MYHCRDLLRGVVERPIFGCKNLPALTANWVGTLPIENADVLQCALVHTA
jgi:hypothetical protein